MNILPWHRGAAGKIRALNDILMNGDFNWCETKGNLMIRLDTAHYIVDIAPEFYDCLEDCHHLSYVTVNPIENFVENNELDMEDESII